MTAPEATAAVPPAARPRATTRHGPGLSPAAYLPLPTIRRAPRLEPPYDDELPTRLRLVPQLEQLPFDEPPPRTFEHPLDFFAQQPTTRDELPDPERWTVHFLRALLEVLVGRRPTTQLQEWTTPVVMATVLRAAVGDRWPRRSSTRPVLRSIRITEPADGVAEICAVVQYGERYSAVAGRLEGLDRRWRCTALHLG